MKKIFKILSILVMVFVLFSCANLSSNPEEPTVTEPQGYSEKNKKMDSFESIFYTLFNSN